jgi:hypothetical protein
LSASVRKDTECSKALSTGVDLDTLAEVCPLNCRLVGNDISVISLNKNSGGEKVFAITNADIKTELVCKNGSTGEIVSRKKFV